MSHLKHIVIPVISFLISIPILQAQSVVAATKMNILYYGFENPVQVAVPEYP